MYKGIKNIASTMDANDLNKIHQTYQTIGSVEEIIKVSYCRSLRGVWDDVSLINQILYGIYYAYKFSKYPVCDAIKMCMVNTFPLSMNREKIMETDFYKDHKKMIDDSIKKIDLNIRGF